MIKIFILTYANPEDLNKNLSSLFSSQVDIKDIEVHIINNHSTKFHLNEEFVDKVIVHHQNLRADWGCGTPTRDWNQALVLGFKNLNNPDCKQIILCQDDCQWDNDWKVRLDEIHKTYTLYQCSWGDCFISLLPDAVKMIGLFDERMCALGYYEGDFLLRAYLYNRDKSSINDHHHYRLWNQTTTVANRINQIADHSRAPKYMDQSMTIFAHKWPGLHPCYWADDMFKNTPTGPAIPSYVFYPYFEYDIENLKEKGYIIP
jgi:hypothetical protein